MKLFRYHQLQLSAVILSLSSLFYSCNQSKVNFSEHIAPIVFKNCSSCHSPNGAAPFNFLTYHDIAKRAKMIVHVTASGYMPPWPADKKYSHFINEKGLNSSEIDLIRKWYEQGCVPGDTANMNIAAYMPNTSILGIPDLILKLEPVAIQNNNLDRFYIMKIPVSLESEKYVRAVEFVPGQVRYAHHVNGHYVKFDRNTNANKGKRIMDIESKSFEEDFAGLSLYNSDGSIPEMVHSAFNYLPGAFGVRYPDGIGGFILGKQGAFVANDIHYGPSRKNLIDSSFLYIYYSNYPPKRYTSEFMMGTNGISAIEPPLMVRANTVSKHISKLNIFSDISVLTINPHMHLIGRSFKAYAVKPNGDTVHLISIPKWQFRWQYFYTFKNPVKIPKGSTVIVEAEFDNTLKNPNNPFNPCRDIGERLDRGGASMRTTDEMLQFIVTYIPYQKGDEEIDLSKP